MNRNDYIASLLASNSAHYQWDEEPVFCLSSDVDWASEDVMESYFQKMLSYKQRATLFLTHQSDRIDKVFSKNLIDRGIHPNFMEKSSHGNSFKEVAETCVKYAPESYGFRSHRAFDVTDITHMLYNDYGYRYVSNQITILQPMIRPILHESGLVNYPVFFEDGTHLYNQLDLSIEPYKRLFVSPGLKILSFHPMNYVFNSPSYHYMRSIKDSLTREQFNNIDKQTISRLQNRNRGIRDFIDDLVEFITIKGFTWLSMNEMYHTFKGEHSERAGN